MRKGSLMIAYVHSATIIVSDQEKALDFYVNTLGFEKVFDNQLDPNMRFVTVVPPGAQTQVALGLPSWYEDGRKPGGYTGISLITRDIDEAYKTLTERGVTFTKPPEMMPWGQRATWFSDPDGNEFFLVEE
jgi:Lactoylglutathione lyase and related lyases|nr:MAG: bleomycin resistance protein [Sphaerobacter thermophilus]